MFVLRSTYNEKVRQYERIINFAEMLLERNSNLSIALEQIKFDHFAISKLIGLLNHNYGIPEIDPRSSGILDGPEVDDYDARKSESDRINARVLRQLQDEFAVIQGQKGTPL